MIVLSVLLSSASSWGFKEELQTYKTVRLHWFTRSPRAEEWASHWKWSSDAVERPGEAVSTDKPLIFICCYFPSAGAVTVLPLDLRGRLKLFLWFLHLEAGAYERLSLWLLSGRRGAEEWITGRDQLRARHHRAEGGWERDDGEASRNSHAPTICCSPIDLLGTFPFKRLHEVKVSR